MKIKLFIVLIFFVVSCDKLKKIFIKPVVKKDEVTIQKKKLTKEEVVKEEVVKEEVVKEEVVKEEVVKEEVAKEEVAKEEVAKEEVAKEEVAKEEVAKESFFDKFLKKIVPLKEEIEEPQEVPEKKLTKEACKESYEEQCKELYDDLCFVDNKVVDPMTWYEDKDHDGFGEKNGKTIKSCENPSSDEVSYSDNTLDKCPNNKETTEPVNWYLDKDRDRHGDVNATPKLSCDKPDDNYYLVADDECPDDVSIFSNDKDCDGVPDSKDGCPHDAKYAKSYNWYVDTDGDGHGDKESKVLKSCGTPKGDKSIKYALRNDDECPKMPKTFKNDTDCDGAEDDMELCPFEFERTDPATWFEDMDGDTLGDVGGQEIVSCEDPSGKTGYNYFLVATDYCPNNKEKFKQGDDCGDAMDNNYTYPVKGELNNSDLKILRERILLSFKTNDNIVGLKNSELYLTYKKDDHMILNMLGIFYMRLKKYDKSIETIEKALEMADEDFYRAYYSINISEVYKKKKLDDKAKEKFLYAVSLSESNPDIKNLVEGRVGGDFLRTYNKQKKETFNYEVSVALAAMYDSNIGLNENIDIYFVDKEYWGFSGVQGYVFPLRLSSDFVFSLKEKKDLRLSKYLSFNYNDNKTFSSFNNVDYGLMAIYNYKEGKQKTFTLTNLIHSFYSFVKDGDYKLSLIENQLTPSISYKIDKKNTVNGSLVVAYGNYQEKSMIPDKEKDYVSMTPTASYAFKFGLHEIKNDFFYTSKVASGSEQRSNAYGIKPKISLNNILNFFNIILNSKVARIVFSDRELQRKDINYNLNLGFNKFFNLSEIHKLYSELSFYYENNKSVDYNVLKNSYDYSKSTIKFSMRYNYE